MQFSLIVFLVLLVLAVTMFTSTDAFYYWRPKPKYYGWYGGYKGYGGYGGYGSWDNSRDYD